MYSGAEEAMASVDRAVEQMKEQANRAHAYAAELGQLRVVGQSGDGAAEVTLTHSGAIQDIYLGRALSDASLDRIRAALLEANAAAQQQLAARVAALAAEAFGAGSATTTELSRQYADLFPTSADEAGSSKAGVLS